MGLIILFTEAIITGLRIVFFLTTSENVYMPVTVDTESARLLLLCPIGKSSNSEVGNA
jgi:hypothetical protein